MSGSIFCFFALLVAPTFLLSAVVAQAPSEFAVSTFLNSADTDKEFDATHGVISDGTHLYFFDSHKYLIRKVNVFSKEITTLVGKEADCASNSELSTGNYSGGELCLSMNYDRGIFFSRVNSNGKICAVPEDEYGKIMIIDGATGDVTVISDYNSIGWRSSFCDIDDSGDIYFLKQGASGLSKYNGTFTTLAPEIKGIVYDSGVILVNDKLVAFTGKGT